MFKSKAETLIFLQKKIRLSKIPKTFYFSVLDWKKEKKNILKKIKFEFSGKIVIRSSAADEDSSSISNAGKYISFLNVNCKKSKEVEKKINSIIKGYKKISPEKSKILIQKMITSINCSGVVFNRDLNTGSKYYVINYDDISGKPDTVTSGISQNSNRLLFVYNKKISDVKSKRFFKLLNSIKELELIYENIPLDIEFIITKKLEIYVLQVRPLVLTKKISFKQDREIDLNLNILKKKIVKKLKNWNTIYGQMPDWNPAEIIGKYPYPLLSSLYKSLILDSSWIKARKIMGYNDQFKEKKLMEIFLGQSFIDVRKSFISFLPGGIQKNLKEKLVNFYIKKLKLNPTLHDKIEFDIAINCFIFDFEKRIQKLCPKLLTKKEILLLKDRYKTIFKNNISKKQKGSIDFNLKKIEKLNNNFEKLKKEKKITKIINYTVNYGTIPFSILARHAFVAENMLRSLERLNILNNKDVNNFKSSLETVTSKFISDCNLLSKNLISFQNFKKKYGHLRPGSYDINSKNYSLFQKDFFIKKKSINTKRKNRFNLSFLKKKKIENILKKNNINMNLSKFFMYLKKSIESREYSKFIFTKNVDLVLKKISEIAKKNNLSKKQISFFTLRDIVDNRISKLSNKNLLYKMNTNKKKHETYLNIRLPILLIDAKGVDVIPFQVSSPNFIGNKKVVSKAVSIDSRANLKKIPFNKKIVLIENADPGFDWLFNFDIKGLITKFGGANSHMAIRCNELRIPAAIGVGEKIFEDLKNNEQLILNCPLKRIETN